MAGWASCEIVQSSRLSKPFHPLHAVAFKFKNTSVHEQVTPPVFFAALSPVCVQKCRTNATCLFVTIHIIEQAESKPPEHKPPRGVSPKIVEFVPDVSLYVSKFFIEHYGINTTDYYSVKMVTPPIMEKVVLGVTTEEAYTWAKQEHWATDLLIAVCKNKLLCRQGDPLLWDIRNASKDEAKKWEQHCLHIVVLETQPVFQGVINGSTQIIVVQLSEAHALQIKQIQAVHTFGFYPVGGNDVPNPLAPLSLIHFTSSLVLPHTRRNNKLFNPVLAILGSAYRILISIKLKFCVNVLTVSPFISSALVEHGIADPLNVVFIAKTTAERVGLEDKSWVKISLAKEDTEGSEDLPSDNPQDLKRERYAQIYHIPSSSHGNIRPHLLVQTQEDVLHVSPQLWFNLNAQPSNLIQPNIQMVVERISCDTNPSQEKAKPSDFQPPFADEVNVALVQAPYYDASKAFDALLTKYFEQTRYIQIGDVISVGRTGGLDVSVSSDDPYKMKPSAVYFKVASIACNAPGASTGCLVNKKNSKLFQLGTVASFVPLTMDTYYSKTSLHPIWRSPFPSGLKNYVVEVKELILPYMKRGFVRHQLPPTLLLTGPLGCGKLTVLECACRHLNTHHHVVDCYDIISDTSAVTEVKLKQAVTTAMVIAPAVLILRHVNLLCKVKDGTQEDARTVQALKEITANLQTRESSPVVIIGTAEDSEKLSSDMRAVFLHLVHIEPPTEVERKQILEGLLTTACIGHGIDINYFAQQTVGFVLGDLCTLVSSATRHAYKRLTNRLDQRLWRTPEEEEELCMAGIFLQHCDFVKALESLQADFSDSLGAPKVPSVMWDDVGGLNDVKEAILDTIQLPLEHPELFASGLRRSGVLLFGPPGTGKTLLAKAVATECQLHFLSVKGPELLNMYVGQSEENVREVFRRARSASPCVIFFDELDSLAPNRGRSGDSGGVMDRVVSQFLAELDGLDKALNVFVVGATNRPDLIDPSLLRPGRFDKLLYVGIGRDQDSQLKILTALTRKFQLAENLNLKDVVSLCSPHLTGADMYALCSDALTQAMSKRIANMKQGDGGGDETEPLVVDIDDFQKAANKLVPSVSEQELAHYEHLQAIMAN